MKIEGVKVKIQKQGLYIIQRYTQSDTHNPFGYSFNSPSSSSFSLSTKLQQQSPMKKQHWVTAALFNDTIVADLLIRMKQPTTTSTSQSLLPRITWGYRKSRSKPPPITNAVSSFKKEQESGSPTTPLYWNGGGVSTSDGYEDLSSGAGARSTKVCLLIFFRS